MKRLLFAFVFCILFSSLRMAAQNLVNAFDGSTTYAVPLVPGVSLTYSSSQVPTIMSRENRDDEASWVGAGWSLNFESIVADLKGTTTTDDDEFFYVSSAGTVRIVKDSSGALRLDNNPSWKVDFAMSGDYVTGITITKDDGSKLKFGDFQTGIGTKQANRCTYAWSGRVTDFSSDSNATQICYEWDLSQAIDPYGVILYNCYYTQEQVALSVGSNGANLSYTRSSYIDHITDSLKGQTIRFIRAARDTNEYQNATTSDYKLSYYETKYLDSIKVFPTQTSTQCIKGIDLSYQLVGSGTKEKRLLTSVTVLDGNSNALPTFNFSYDSTKYYILNSVQNQTGGTTQFVTQTATPSYANNFSLSVGSKGQVVSAATVVAGYDNHNSQLQIRKWVGEWKSKIVTFTDAMIDTIGFIKATDDHVLLVYRTKGQNNKILMYDWRYDIQDWQMDICDSASNMGTAYNQLVADISPSGSHVALVVGGTNTPRTFKLWEWNAFMRSWNSPVNQSVSVFPQRTFQISDNMAIYDSSSLYLLQWKKSGGTFSWSGQTSVCSLGYDEQISLQNTYIGRWSQTVDSLYAYGLKYNSTSGYCQVVIQLAQKADPYTQQVVAQFADERILMLDDNSMKIWKKDGTGGFTSLSPSSVSIYEGSGWGTKVDISNDWAFVYNYRTGSVSGTPAYETILYGFKWNSSTGLYDTAGSYQQPYCSIMPYSGQYSPNIILNDDFVAATMVVVIGNGVDYDGPTIGAFRLDRTNPSSWHSGRVETNAMSGTIADSQQVIAGGNFLGSFDKNGNCAVNFYHGIDKNFGNTITVYRTSQMSQNSNMGTSTSAVTRNYSYDTAPTFDPSLTYAGYSWVKDSLGTGQGGSTKVSFSNQLSTPRLRGVVTKVERYSKEGMALVDQETPTITVYEDPNKWYLFQVRKTQDQSYTNAVTRTTSYVYDDFNGHVSQATEAVQATSNLSELRDKVTDITYAYSQYSTMKSANMLSQIYEQKTYANISQPTTITVTSSLFATSGIDLDTASFYIGRSQYVKYIYSTDSSPYGDNNLSIGTSGYGSTDILGQCCGSSISSPDSFWAVAGTRYYLETSVAEDGVHKVSKSASVTVWYCPGTDTMNYLTNWTRTEYDADKRPYRSLTYDGANWITTDSVVSRDSYGHVIERSDVNQLHTTTKWGYSSTLPVATIVNASNGETFVENCETFASNPYGYLASNFSAVNADDFTSFSQSSDAIAGSSQYVHVATTSANGGIQAAVGNLNTSKMYEIEFDFKATGGTMEVATYSNGSSDHSEVTYAAAGEWYHAKINWTVRGDGTSSKVYFRSHGTTGVTFYLDNVRIYPSGALCTSTTYDPNTLLKIGETDANGVTTLYRYDGFGRLTQVLR